MSFDADMKNLGIVREYTAFKLIQIIYLERGKYQPRTNFNSESLISLAETIKTDGVLEPILVRPIKDNRYEIIAGERRWRAAQIAGMYEVPCLIRDYSDEQAARISLIENIVRENLDPISQANAMGKMIDEFGYTHEEMGRAIGKSRAVVTNTLRLLKLDGRVQALIKAGKLSEAHGKLLVSVPIQKQYGLSLKIIEESITTSYLEKHVNEIDNEFKSSIPDKLDINVLKLAQQLSDYFGYQVTFKMKRNNSGQMAINFSNLDHLDGILNKIGYLKEYSD